MERGLLCNHKLPVILLFAIIGILCSLPAYSTSFEISLGLGIPIVTGITNNDSIPKSDKVVAPIIDFKMGWQFKYCYFFYNIGVSPTEKKVTDGGSDFDRHSYSSAHIYVGFGPKIAFNKKTGSFVSFGLMAGLGEYDSQHYYFDTYYLPDSEYGYKYVKAVFQNCYLAPLCFFTDLHLNTSAKLPNRSTAFLDLFLSVSPALGLQRKGWKSGTCSVSDEWNTVYIDGLANYKPENINYLVFFPRIALGFYW